MNEPNQTELAKYSVGEILYAADLLDRELASPAGMGSGGLRIEAKRWAMVLYQHLKTRSPTELADFIWQAQEYKEIY